MKKLSHDSEIFLRGVEDIITQEELKKLLDSGKQLRIKHGLDATGPDLHIGHAASLWKIRALQEAGHKAVILLGDITTGIGDPTGRVKTRPALSAHSIAANLESIEKQVKSILIPSREVLEFHRSSEWYRRMRWPDFLALFSHVTHARLIEREMFQKRIKAGAEIFIPELIYPVLQGYDSVMLRDNLTIIGSDQLFNEHLGRFLQGRYGQAPQVIVTLKILPGLDGGEKMSKSAGNYIGLLDSPQDKFGKAMRVLDRLIIPYLETYTTASEKEIQEIAAGLNRRENPMKAKLFFAEMLVKRYHGQKIAEEEREGFLGVFSQKELPPKILSVEIAPGIWEATELLLKLGLASSRVAARRLILQKAVKIDGAAVSPQIKIVDVKSGMVIQAGKRRWIKIK